MPPPNILHCFSSNDQTSAVDVVMNYNTYHAFIKLFTLSYYLRGWESTSIQSPLNHSNYVAITNIS